MKNMIKYILIFGFILYGVSIGNHFLNKAKASQFSKFTIKVKKLSDSTCWYYEIYNNQHLLIKQTNIPGASGNQFFRSKEDAKEIGLLVVSKLEQKLSPSITINDLKNRNIDFDN